MRVIRRQLSDPPALSPDRQRDALDQIITEITRPTKHNDHRERSHPHAVRRAAPSRFPVKQPGEWP
ncbi:hypothetical protein [Parafrankia elaeagni]|uniref:hypothetical protein n=1 Tax=Parafrankia elaeagni TaxID=222534 RepID=UPI000375B098|nr:hypothetical protein [Parafrankia elaeagni]